MERGEDMILVTGANGMVGSYISWSDAFKTDKAELDVSNEKDVSRYKNFKVDCIIHLAAETDLEFCELNPRQAFKVNTLGTHNMLSLAYEKDIPFVYISTAGVFDGIKNTPYTEEDMPNPINMYGFSKWCGDLAVNAYPKSYVFRASWMMGGGPKKDKKFVSKIIHKINIKEPIIYGIYDILGSPTYAKDLIKNIRIALDNKLPYGLYNLSCDGVASRADVADEICALMEYSGKVKHISGESFQKKDALYYCPRSKNEMLDVTKAKKNGLYVRDWKDALKEYMEEWK